MARRRKTRFLSEHTRYLRTPVGCKISSGFRIPHVVMFEDKLPAMCEKLGLTIVHQTRLNRAPATIRVMKRETPLTDFQSEEEFIGSVLKALSSDNISLIKRVTHLIIPGPAETYDQFSYVSGVKRYWAFCNIQYDKTKNYSLAELAPRSSKPHPDLAHSANISIQREKTDPKNQWSLRYSMLPDYNFRYANPLTADFVVNACLKLDLERQNFKYAFSLGAA